MHLPLRRWFPFGLPLRSEASARARRARAPGETSPVPRIRRFAAELARDPLPAPGSGRPAPAAGTLLTAGLLTEALRYLWDRYAGTVPGAVTAAHDHAAGALGPMRTRLLDETFRELYPPEDPVGSGGGEETDRELVLLRLTLENPAMEPLRDLFHDAPLAARTPWQTFVDRLEEGLGAGGPLPGTDQGLMDLLRAPMRAHPDSLEAQLAWVRSRWGALLPPEMLQELVLAADILREETRPRFGGGPGPAEVPRFTTAAPGEEENFSPDASWMPDVVLMAKSTYVWLDQLSRAWGRDIRRLDQIPDEELDRLAAWGVTGLWLIGLWERSPASRTIKRWMGNPEAEASAYSLWDYEIAADLGGDEAWRNLAARAGDRGIRLAADMVPNHTGIDSRWMVEHPERFLQLDAPPYPSYYFTCQDLCGHPDATVQIEDGYWSRSDAAVVFRCENRRDGRVRYVYHGNDGTSMPWNDTAQLDFLRRDTREAVIERILHVARRFPIIRFDAAMTLARKHFQRLWYPAPGDAGAVPSRAERGLSREAFEAAAPVEFWREVVDRVAAEAPGTLLLAEAFWLMEGYFVRTLGMHRVYNSAFMNMLKMEENAKYRATLRNVLEFSPDVLQRFVNFMNNPDERTAVEQFGRGDKYFGCALLLVTLPGLPMLGHGQVEGFTEKYGMEYRRAFLHETP
ncbi:MAG: alpha-amylase, partial [Deltaproteobacteria bacterium]|nr:alpha-amylase [Deltaproteobacteria bacterium]